MTKKNLTIAGLVLAGGALAYEHFNRNHPKKELIEKTSHIGIAIGLGLITFALLKAKD